MSFFERFSNSKFFIICDYIYKFVVLNIFFLCTLLCGLVVFTLIPSLTAYFTVVKGFNKNREFSLIEGYFTIFFHNFKKNVLLSLSYSSMLFIVIFNSIYFYESIRDYKVITLNNINYEYKLNNENLFTTDKNSQIILNTRNNFYILDFDHQDSIIYSEKKNNIYSDGLLILLDHTGKITQIRDGSGYFLVLEENSYKEYDYTNNLWGSENKNIFFNLEMNLNEEGYVLLTSPKSMYGHADEFLEDLKKELENDNLINIRLYNSDIEEKNVLANKKEDRTFGLICYYLFLLMAITLFLMVINCALINIYFPYLNNKEKIKYSLKFVLSLPIKTLLTIFVTVSFIYIATAFIYLIPLIVVSIYLYIVFLIYRKDYNYLVSDTNIKKPMDVVDIIYENNLKKLKKRNKN